MSNSPKIKSPPKVVAISLQSPQKKKKQSSPPHSRDLFNSSMSTLKKTFQTPSNIFTQIQQHHHKKILQHELEKQQQKYLQQEQQRDQQNHKELTTEELRQCRRVFQILDKDKKGYIIEEDLKGVGQGRTKGVEIVRGVFVRKGINSFFDFVFAMWDMGRLEELVACGGLG